MKPDYEFGPFSLNASTRLLFRAGQMIPLTPKVTETLLVLVESRGRLVEKEELLKAVWPDTFVEEGNLTQNISVLRKALGPGCIETVPKRGYRLALPVVERDKEEAPTGESPAPPATSAPRRRWLKALALLAAPLGAFLVWLAWLRPPGEIRSVAVLPFLNLSPGSENEYFADGLAEELIGALARVEGLRVPARTSAFQFKGKAQDIREIAKRLRVQAVLEGSVRRDKNRVRITAQLNRAADGYHLWSETYEEELKEVFAIQEHICQDIVQALRIRLSGGPGRRLVKRYTEDTEAYTLYLKGRYFWNKRTLEGVQKAVQCFREVIAKDPGYPLAYAGLADSFILFGQYSVLPPDQALPEAKSNALKALKLDPGLGEARASLASAIWMFDWNRTAAEAEFRRAIEANPAYPTAHQWYAEYLSLVGRHADALRQIDRALELDPLSLIANGIRALAFYFAGEYDRAIEQCRTTLELDPNFPMTPFFLGYAYVQKGRYEDAIAEFRKAMALSGGRGAPYLGHALAMAGRRSEALRILEQLIAESHVRYVDPYDIATVYVGLDDKEQAFAWLERAYARHSHWLLYLRMEPRFRPLRTDPRFGGLLKRLDNPSS